eukprot:4912604-Alexandrium_andersonii.AAC.1
MGPRSSRWVRSAALFVKIPNRPAKAGLQGGPKARNRPRGSFNPRSANPQSAQSLPLGPAEA